MKVIAVASLANHPFANLSLKRIKSDSGKIHDHLLLEKKDAVCLTLFDTHTSSVLLVGQFRAGALYNNDVEGSFTLEPIAGHIDPGESPIDAAIRESNEETAIQIDKNSLEFVAKGLTSPGVSNEMHYHYFAKFDSSKIDMKSILDAVHGIDDEEIKVSLIKIETAMQMVHEGKIFASHSIIGIMYAYLKYINKTI